MRGQRLVTSAEELDTFSRNVQAGVKRWENNLNIFLSFNISSLKYYVAPRPSLEGKWSVCWSRFIVSGRLLWWNFSWRKSVGDTICSIQPFQACKISLMSAYTSSRGRSAFTWFGIQTWNKLMNSNMSSVDGGSDISGGNKSCVGAWRITHQLEIGGKQIS